MSVLETYQSIVTAKEADSSLSGLTSTSRFSVWRALAYSVATAWNGFLSLLVAAKQEIIDEARKATPGNAAWAVDRAKEFRWNSAGGAGYGYVFDPATKKPAYTEGDNDPAALIVTFAAVDESGDVPILLANKGPVGALVPLETAERLAFQQYVNDVIRPWPARLGVSSRPADKVQITATLTYYPVAGDQQANVEAAIRGYLANGIDFKGKINRNKLIDAVQALNGVKDFTMSVFQFRPASATSWQDVGNEAQLYACHAELDTITFMLVEAAYV